MTFWFLLMSLLSAWLTYNVYRPRYRGRGYVRSFFLGWLWGELAPHVIAVQLLLAAVFAWAGAIEGVFGYAALAILAASCGALGYSYLESESAAVAIERALVEGLGEGYESRILPELRARFPRGPRWRELLRPFKMRRPDVEKISGIHFDRQRGIDLKLDVYRHRSMPRGCPVLLQLHGGAWAIGDKKEQGLPLMYQMAEHGWLCVSANYRLSPHATFPDHLIDAKKALAWIREHGERYGAEPSFVVVTGGSAGGHLASLVALTANDPGYQPGFEGADTSVSACVPIYAVYDFTDRFGSWCDKRFEVFLERKVMKGSREELPELYTRASPMDNLRPDRPPFLVVHGDKDSLAPVEDARRFVEMLRATSDVPVVYAEIPDAQHAFEIFKSLRSQLVVDGIERYLTFVYSAFMRERGTSEAGSGREEPELGIAGAATARPASSGNGQFVERS
jgi:acetyl esterase/lipase